jgi:hypothetical protein
MGARGMAIARPDLLFQNILYHLFIYFCLFLVVQGLFFVAMLQWISTLEFGYASRDFQFGGFCGHVAVE